jgi:hypothetical protein
MKNLLAALCFVILSSTAAFAVCTLPGDTNQSDTVSIAEVQQVINAFLGLDPCGTACTLPGDTNDDDNVSIAEVQQAINAFLGLNSCAVNAVTVSGAGSVSADAADTVYTLQPGTYVYDVSGFAAGDRLVFPAGVAPTVDNNDWNDGIVLVEWASGGSLITVRLTGYTPDQDWQLNSVSQINAMFGEGTVQ